MPEPLPPRYPPGSGPPASGAKPVDPIVPTPDPPEDPCDDTGQANDPYTEAKLADLEVFGQ